MKFFAAALCLVVLVLQVRLWLSDSGVREVGRLREAVQQQRDANSQLEQRNAQLAAEVADLKKGMAALEERARSELGMVGRAESFFQVVPRRPPTARPADARTRTALR